MHIKMGYVPVLVAELAEQRKIWHFVVGHSRNSPITAWTLTFDLTPITGSKWRKSQLFIASDLEKFNHFVAFVKMKSPIWLPIFRVAKFFNLSEIAVGLTGTLLVRGMRSRVLNREDLWELVTTVFVSDYFPSFTWVDKLSGFINRLDKIFNNLESFYQELIDEHLFTRWVKKMEEENILDILIQLNHIPLTSTGIISKHC